MQSETRDSKDQSGTVRRRLETPLAWFSLSALLLYVPGETWSSWPDLANAGYIVDVIAFLLLAFGGVHSLRARPSPGTGPLCGAWGYCACLAWRCYFMRVYSRERSLGIYQNQPAYVEPVLAIVLIIAFITFGLCLHASYTPKPGSKGFE